MRYMRYLSYMMKEAVPAYGDTKGRLRIRAKKSISKGDSCNTYSVTLQNHWGTHIDAPAHFFEDGRRISDYEAAYWRFERPCVVDVPLEENRIIKLDDLSGRIDKKSEVILIKTGFHKLRGTRQYSFSGPAIDPRIAVWLRKNTDARAVGFDFVSAGSYGNKPLGRKAHRAFLDPRGEGQPIVIIEDMDLSADLGQLECLYAAPLLIKNIDSAPCTVLGIFRNRRCKR